MSTTVLKSSLKPVGHLRAVGYTTASMGTAVDRVTKLLSRRGASPATPSPTSAHPRSPLSVPAEANGQATTLGFAPQQSARSALAIR